MKKADRVAAAARVLADAGAELSIAAADEPPAMRATLRSLGVDLQELASAALADAEAVRGPAKARATADLAAAAEVVGRRLEIVGASLERSADAEDRTFGSALRKSAARVDTTVARWRAKGLGAKPRLTSRAKPRTDPSPKQLSQMFDELQLQNTGGIATRAELAAREASEARLHAKRVQSMREDREREQERRRNRRRSW